MNDGQSPPMDRRGDQMDEHSLAEVERAGTQFNAVTAMTVDRANALTAESVERRDSGQPPRDRKSVV